MDTSLAGKRVKLIRMEDPYTDLKEGDEGTIKGTDDMNQILVQWDSGSTLSLIPEIDEYEIIEESKVNEEIGLLGKIIIGYIIWRLFKKIINNLVNRHLRRAQADAVRSIINRIKGNLKIPVSEFNDRYYIDFSNVGSNIQIRLFKNSKRLVMDLYQKHYDLNLTDSEYNELLNAVVKISNESQTKHIKLFEEYIKRI